MSSHSRLQAGHGILGLGTAAVIIQRSTVGADGCHTSADLGVARALSGCWNVPAELECPVWCPGEIDIRLDGTGEAIADVRRGRRLAVLHDVGGAIAEPRGALLAESAIARHGGGIRRLVTDVERFLDIGAG